LRTVDRLMLRELIPPLLFGVAAFTSLFFAGGYLSRLTGLLVQGVPFPVVAELFLLYLPSVIVMTLPMSVLLAVLLAFSRMSSDSEMVALWAGGVSLWRIMRPVVAVAVVVTLISYVLSEGLAPQAQRRSTELRERALGEITPLQKAFIISDVEGGRYNSVVFVNGGMDPQTRELRNVTIFTGFTGQGPQVYFFAERARWERGTEWRLYNGAMRTLDPGGGATVNTFREWSTRAVNINRTPEEVMEEQRDPDELNFRQLAQRIQRMKRTGGDTLKLEVELYNKLSVPLASLVFALIAAPLGLRPHRGGAAVGFGLSIGLIFAYWMVWQYSSALAKAGQISPIAGSFMADVVFLTVGLLLLRRASR